MVTWWLGRGTGPGDFKRNFADHQPGLRVEYLGADSLERTLVALADGTAPDIVMIPRAGTVAGLARQGRLADLSSYAWTRRVLPLARAVCMHEGRLYGVPRSVETMVLFYDRALFRAEGWQPPHSLRELEDLAAAMQVRGIVPFGAGTADYPPSVELYFSLIVNHHAGPANVRAALLGRLPWTAPVFRDAVELLRSWFERGWFGTTYFTDGWAEGFARIATGEAGMSPNMSWIFGEITEASGDVGVAPFPTLRDGLAAPLYIFGTASVLAVNAASPRRDAAAAVLDRLFTNEVRRAFSRDLPGDWNLPLTDPDAAGLARVTTPEFAATAVATTAAVRDAAALRSGPAATVSGSP
ncbi:ABC transporter substrate-binding protein [Paractinoplanes rishiriensis]|uniref:ABC transporter substrate-binding protein n=1 Tax=Paractinoplanes rishiriensis TaxID=1050105 RepID=A0A919MYX6_9ACTN|nr:extracellular solute-binding protein [Actinoplanes rishiriensis]GIF00495.1 hypothetical protein Ari01nite_79590 [Actinoplanes rishiriensis]